MSIAEKLVTVAENQQAVFEAGKQAEKDRFWDEYQNKGSRINYLYAFAGTAWVDDVYDPKYTITPSENATRMFTYSYITDTRVPIDMTGSVRNVTEMFAYSRVVTIRELVFSDKQTNSYTSSFTGCSRLVNITASGVITLSISFKDSPLSRESIESVVAALSDTATGETATFKQSAVDAAFTAEEWDALRASKPNWTVTSV